MVCLGVWPKSASITSAEGLREVGEVTFLVLVFSTAGEIDGNFRQISRNFEAHFALSTWLLFKSSLDWSDGYQLLPAYTSHDFSQLSVGTSAFLVAELGGSPHQLFLDSNPRLVLWCVLQKSSWLCLLKAYRGVFFVVLRHVKGIPRCGTHGPSAFLSWKMTQCHLYQKYLIWPRLDHQQGAKSIPFSTFPVINVWLLWHGPAMHFAIRNG